VPALAFVAIYAITDNHAQEHPESRGRSLVTVAMLVALTSMAGGWRDGKAHAARRQATQPARVATPEAIVAQPARHLAIERWAAPSSLAAEGSDTFPDADGRDETVTCVATPLVAPERVAAVARGETRASAVVLVSPESEAEMRAQELAPIPRDNARPLHLRVYREAAVRDACKRALASLRRRNLLAPEVAVTRSVLVPRTGPLPSPAGVVARVVLGALVVLATLATRAAR